MKELCFLPVTELSSRIRDGVLSPVELVETFLERIRRLNPKVNAYCLVLEKEARKKAEEAERALKEGKKLGPLHGIPIAIKDLTPMHGVKTTFGSRLFENFVPSRDAVVVERLKKAGAIPLGKTNTPEFGWMGNTVNALFGATRNPWNLERTAGGSSGGSAAAVAAGMAPFAEGSDGGGSIRIPSSACGVFGLKPTSGLIPMDLMVELGLGPFGHVSPFITHGPIARSVKDAALLLSVMVGYHDVDPFSLPSPEKDYTELEGEVKGLKIAYSPNLGYFEVDERVRKVVEEAAWSFEELGMEVVEKNPVLPNKEEIEGAFQTLWVVAFSSILGDLSKEEKEKLTPEVQALSELGKGISAVEYKRAEMTRGKVWLGIQELFKEFDFLLTPTLAVPPFPVNQLGPTEINGKEVNPLLGWILTYPFNLTGHPAASVPCGWVEGLPIGMQVIGKRFSEKLILKVCLAFENLRPWTHRLPPLE
ncbi:MAG: amidase [Candidatus Hadarchaeales archaeon]